MFNNGYNSFYPYQSNGLNRGVFSNIKGRVSWSSILNNTQKTLNIINQAIPVFYQIKPLWNNTKTIFKIISAVKTDDKKPQKNIKNNKVNITSIIQEEKEVTYNTPNFFL